MINKDEYTVVQCSNKHIHIYKNGKMIMHVYCNKKMTNEELLKQIDFYEDLTSGKFDDRREQR